MVSGQVCWIPHEISYDSLRKSFSPSFVSVLWTVEMLFFYPAIEQWSQNDFNHFTSHYQVQLFPFLYSFRILLIHRTHLFIFWYYLFVYYEYIEYFCVCKWDYLVFPSIYLMLRYWYIWFRQKLTSYKILFSVYLFMCDIVLYKN